MNNIQELYQSLKAKPSLTELETSFVQAVNDLQRSCPCIGQPAIQAKAARCKELAEKLATAQPTQNGNGSIGC